MDELEILIQAILSLKDVSKSKKQILSELPELERQLQSDEKARIKIIAGLETEKSKDLIKSQLESLASQANAPTIKVGVDVAQGNTQNIVNNLKDVEKQAQQTSNVINQALSRNYASDNKSFIQQIKKFKDEKVAVQELTRAFEEQKITIKSITAEKTYSGNGVVNGLTVSIQSSNGELENFNYKLKKTKDDTEFVLRNIKATDAAVQRLAQSQAKYNDQLKAGATKLQTQLDKIKSSASIGSKPIDFKGNSKLTDQYNTAKSAIERFEKANKSTMASAKAEAESEIATLQRMVKEFQNAAYAANELRARDITTIKDTQEHKLNKFINQINNSKVPIQAFEKDIENLRGALLNFETNPKSLTEFLNQFDIAKSKLESFKEFYKSVGANNNQLEKMVATWKKQGIYTDELKSKVATLKNELTQIVVSKDTTGLANWTQKINQMSTDIGLSSEKQERLNQSLKEQLRIQKDILSYQAQIANLENNPNKTSKVAELKSVVAKRQEELNAMQQETFEATKLMTVEEQKEFLIKNTVKEQERLTIAEKNALDIQRRSKELTEKKASDLEAQIKTYETINTKAAKAYKSEFDSLKKDLELARATGTPEEIDKIRARYTTLKSEIKAAGKEGQTFFQKMAEGAKKFASWMSLTTIISYVVRDIRKMVSTVIELDTALIDLKKTFKGTEADLKSFYYSANDVAKQLGVTTAEVIKQASAWSRLGFSTKQQAIEMAKLSSMFASISPGMDVDTATDGLLSIIKAFGYETNEVLDGIMSKVNIVGNEFGTSNSEIVEMLRRSSSAMKEANNNLSETIALETSAVEITRDAAGVGTAFKTISMRLRGKTLLPPYKETYMLCA